MKPLTLIQTLTCLTLFLLLSGTLRTCETKIAMYTKRDIVQQLKFR